MPTKTLSFKRANWLSEGASLEHYIKRTFEIAKSIAERTVERANGQLIRCQSVKYEDHGVYLHLTSETPGAPTSVVKILQSSDAEGLVYEERPPRGAEYLDGDFFCLVSGNNVFMCSTGMRDGSFRFYLQRLFQIFELDPDSVKFELRHVVDMPKLQMMKEYGVKEIILNTTMHRATESYVDRSISASSGVIKAVGDHFRSVFGTDVQEIEDNIVVQITIKSDLRLRGAAIVGDKRLEYIAEDILDDETPSDYTIITKNDQKIRGNEISVSKRVEFRSFGKSINRVHAWEELRTYMTENIESEAVLT